MLDEYNYEEIESGRVETLVQAIDKIELLERKLAIAMETNEALEVELKEVCDVLIRKCPEMKEWVMLNWKRLYEVQDEVEMV